MLHEKTTSSPDVQPGLSPPRSDTITGDQELHVRSSQGITDKYAKYVGGTPDGGLKAWSVIVASMLTTFCSLGYVNSTWGIFQDYYEHVLLPDESPSTIAWIGSVQIAFIFLPGLITGRLFDLGHFKIPYFAASCGLIVCTFLTAECKHYWQFFLVQGFFTGLFSGIIYAPAVSVVSHWFSKKKGMALGIVSIGSSLGGILFPITGQNLLPLVGFKWTVRTFGLMMLVALGIANLTIDRRLPPANVQDGLLNLTAFRNPAYTIYCISGMACFLGLYTALTYLSLSAAAVGVSTNFSFYLVAIANAASGFGRLSAGLLADQIGPLNAMIPFTSLAGILTFSWPYASSQRELIAISLIYGFASGTYVSLFVAPPMAMGDVGDVGRRMGMFMTIAALGMLAGPPISGAIIARTGGFKDPGFYAGGIVMFSVLLLFVVRYLHLGQLCGKC
ncbi:MFS general substrate transporter [Pisolithus orientalis]|uniref:MFS general substrate transporter n=1 Tax=Pisolithus orientalis TaxID=936130 RepID=UPI002223EE45|nr:MFS general substrate transporter [Pisolithus orientalis]KAI5997685.1 MFS general substrate transporter [Pisolithus orientalis]